MNTFELKIPENPYPFGEMTPIEREHLYTWVYTFMPEIALEVGCKSGHGSTFYISKAMEKNEERWFTKTTLYTCDIAGKCQEYDNVVFHQMKSTDLIYKLIAEKKIPEFIFFDGPEDADLALSDIKILEPYLLHGTQFAMHDWHTGRRFDGLISVKSAKIRPYMESSENWKLITCLEGDDPTIKSVGLSLYEWKPTLD